ncbi:MAG TPA: molybdenum cofactor biosynthesis protein MoaE [Acidimicrobiales bacterium]|nr:molybdenum cofactor biosynthesis protein MoaE [Acidimicrobiales bacterium]
MLQQPTGDDWVGLTEEPLPVAEALAWAVVPGCGGLVTFCGTVRDFSDGRDEVSSLDYEAYPEQVVPRLAALCAAARARWPEAGRIVLLHRVGHLEVREAAVVVCASAPHRAEAFALARFLIDTLKATIPIWKLERWADGEEWSDGTCEIADVPEAHAVAHGHHAGPAE